MEEPCGNEVPSETISKIIDLVVEDMLAWQNWPLEAIYSVLLIDCLVVRGARLAGR